MRWISLAERNLKETLRDPLSLGLGAAMPCALLAVFASLGRNAPVPVFRLEALAPAMAVFSFSFLIMFSAMLVAKDRSSGLFGRLRATPLAPLDFLLAYSLVYLAFSLVQVLACYLFAGALGARLGAGALASLLVLAPTAAACVGLGLVLGSLCAENQISGLGSALVTAIGFFGGGWFDLEQAGGFFAAMGRYFPFARAVHGARALFMGGSLADAGYDLAVTGSFAVLSLAVGLACLRSKTSRK